MRAGSDNEYRNNEFDACVELDCSEFRVFVYYGTFLYLVLLIPVFTVLGLTMSFLATVIQFYKEIGKRNIPLERPCIILQQPYNNNQQSIFQGGTRQAVVYIPPLTQNVRYTNHQEPYNPAFTQEYGYSTGQYLNLITDFWKWKRSQRDV